MQDSSSVKAAGEGDRATQIQGEIEFRGLNFAYNGVPVLHDINLRIPAGSSLAIVGPTGSGKTTLVSLIPRIYDAAPGSVLIDGRPIREFPLESLRRQYRLCAAGNVSVQRHHSREHRFWQGRCHR